MGTPIWCDEGENRVLNILLGDTPVDGAWYLGLYKNSVEPGEDAKVSDLTEPSGFGYARKPLSRGLANWTITADEATYPEQTLLAQGGDWGNIYGYFITTTLTGTGGKLMGLEHLGSAYSVLDGKGIKIIPKLKCS
jgi:hypothetical protein